MLLAGDLGGPRAVPIHHVPDAMSRSWKFDLCEVASELVVCKKPGLKSRARQLNLGLGNLNNSRELLEIGVVLGCLILGLRAMMLCV